MCFKTFKLLKHLDIHQYVHFGERPYRCDMWNKTFSDRCHLNVHQCVHTGERPYCCGVCRKLFSHKCVLNRHLLSYCNQHPYSRDMYKSFIMVHYLRNHHLQIVGSLFLWYLKKIFCCTLIQFTHGLKSCMSSSARIFVKFRLFIYCRCLEMRHIVVYKYLLTPLIFYPMQKHFLCAT